MKNKKKNVGIFIFNNVEILDFAGSYEVFSSTRLTKESRPDIYNIPSAFNTFTVSERKKEIITSGGQQVTSNYNFKSCPQLDILIIPGGAGTRVLLKNKTVLKWILYNKNIDVLASVCTGALLLAQNGLLNNRKATTHWGAYDLLKSIDSSINIIQNQRFVFDKYYSSAGVSSGIDMALHIVGKIS